MIRTIAGFCLVSCIFTAAATADDWPQWMGERRDSIWRESGVVKQFPDSGLPVKWRAKVAYGYAGPAVAAGKVYVMDFVSHSGDVKGDPGGTFEGTERLLCLDAETGKPLWEHAYDCTYEIAYPSGPRCTPSVDEGRVYALGAEGQLSCLDAATGDVVWEKDFKTDLGAKPPRWGVAAHPLVDGDRLYCIVGGAGSVAVCFDKRTGEEIWRSMDAVEQGYCPPMMIEHGGQQELVIWHAEAVNGLDPATGDVHWSVPLKPKYRMSIAAPQKSGDFLFASGVGHQGVMMKLTSGPGGKPEAEVVWRGKPKMGIFSCHTTPFLQEGIMYGCDSVSGALVAARLEDGERLWQTREPTTGGRGGSNGTAFLVKNGQRFFIFNELGDLILAHLSPDGYEQISRFHVLEPTNSAFGRSVVWSHPAFAQRSMFARNDEEIVCVNLAEGG